MKSETRRSGGYTRKAEKWKAFKPGKKEWGES